MSKKSSTFAPAFLRKGTLHQGKMAEWSNASVLKTDVRKRTGGSNPSLSARHSLLLRIQACLSEQMQRMDYTGCPWQTVGIVRNVVT